MAAGSVDKLTVDLTGSQVVLLRQLVFEDLAEAAETLQGQAQQAAIQLDAGLVALDAFNTYDRVRRSAELLDLLGWGKAPHNLQVAS
jgi:hypothetical protein